MDHLKSEFAARLRASIRECREIGYHPNNFEQMLGTSDGVALAKRLVCSGDLQYGLKELAKLDRLDLSVEMIMLEEKFLPLFNQAERDAAQWRLSQFG